VIVEDIARGTFGIRVLEARGTGREVRLDGPARLGRLLAVHVRRQMLVQLAAGFDVVSHVS